MLMGLTFWHVLDAESRREGHENVKVYTFLLQIAVPILLSSKSCALHIFLRVPP